MINDLELAWAAGLFEGEGSVRIQKPSLRNWGSLLASVVNTDQQILAWFQARWPGYMKAATGLRENQRPAWVWVISSHDARQFLSAIRPFVVRDAVREKIDHGIAFQNQKSRSARWFSGAERYAYAEEQWNAYWWMGVLNKRGVDADKWRKPR